MIQYPDRLSLAQLPTPVTRLDRFPLGRDDVTLWVKRDELTGTEVSGNKIRKLEFTIAEALNQGCTTLITCGGVQSNHCRSTAILGARLGLKVHLILRGQAADKPEGNLLLDYLSGAEISYLPPGEWASHRQVAEQLVRDYAQSGAKALFIPTGASDEIGLWGYVAASEELADDFKTLNMVPDYVVTATGSGGTQAGLIVGMHILRLPTQVLAFNVCDDAAYFDAKIRRMCRCGSSDTVWK